MPYVSFTKKWLHRGLLAASVLGVFACGDDITKTTEVGRTEFADFLADMPECSDKLVGQSFFVRETGALYVCADSTWKKAAESGSISADTSAKTGCSLRDNGDGTVTQVCGEDSVLLNKALCGKTPYETDSSFCLDGTLYAKFDGKIYDPESEFPFGGRLAKKSLAWRYRNPNVEYDTILDARDGRAYLTLRFGDQVWMAENLNYRGTGSDTLGICANFDESKCDLYGRFYGWLEAMDLEVPQDTSEDGTFEDSIPENARGICPEGFRVPIAADYEQLRIHLDSLGYNAEGVIATASNTSGLGIFLGGYCDGEAGSADNFGKEFYLWTYDPEASGFERVLDVYSDIDDIFGLSGYLGFSFMDIQNNLRCIQAQKN